MKVSSKCRATLRSLVYGVNSDAKIFATPVFEIYDAQNVLDYGRIVLTDRCRILSDGKLISNPHAIPFNGKLAILARLLIFALALVIIFPLPQPPLRRSPYT